MEPADAGAGGAVAKGARHFINAPLTLEVFDGDFGADMADRAEVRASRPASCAGAPLTVFYSLGGAGRIVGGVTVDGGVLSQRSSEPGLMTLGGGLTLTDASGAPAVLLTEPGTDSRRRTDPFPRCSTTKAPTRWEADTSTAARKSVAAGSHTQYPRAAAAATTSRSPQTGRAR